ncbi:hypothetical protein ACO22_03550 [Paracoccidioides brasiliensis]|uniref:Uncharacterized protein n=1 Tax=Paracoccidioides brasiliensis TaxID=121759 RepID=A0A1D2JFU1_PARBR|nr:hypothetical protein ACO22_03550 [Paracoccidioides brasiliensis]
MEALLAGKMSRRTCTASREHLRQVLQVGLRKRALVSTQPLEGFSSGKPPGETWDLGYFLGEKRKKASGLNWNERNGPIVNLCFREANETALKKSPIAIRQYHT